MASSISLQATHPLPPSTARLRFKPVPTSISTSLTLFPFPLHLSSSLPSSSSTVSPSPHIRRLRLSSASASASASASEALGSPTSTADSANHENAVVLEPKKEKLKVGVKILEKPRLVLKFIWMDKNIGLGLDQMIPGHGCVPLSPYYFWPRKDAWEELKAKLEEKPWISQKTMVILLNQATDIINLWQQAGGNE